MICAVLWAQLFHHSFSHFSSHLLPLACRPRQGRISGPLFHVLISNHAKGWLLEALLCVSEQLCASHLSASLIMQAHRRLSAGRMLKDYCFSLKKTPQQFFPSCFHQAASSVGCFGCCLECSWCLDVLPSLSCQEVSLKVVSEGAQV